jgi:hypothetical protein
MSFIAFEILLLDQDLQDFLALGLSLDGACRSQLFGSGFSGFSGFLSVGP